MRMQESARQVAVEDKNQIKGMRWSMEWEIYDKDDEIFFGFASWLIDGFIEHNG